MSDERRKQLRQSIHDWLEKGAYREYVTKGIMEVDAEGHGIIATLPDHPFTKAEIDTEFDAMVKEGVVVQEPGYDFWVSVEMMPSSAHRYKMEAKWQHIDEGDHVTLPDGRKVIVDTIDFEGEQFSDHEMYDWFPLEGVVPEPPEDKRARIVREQDEAQSRFEDDQKIAAVRDKRYNELLQLAPSICKKRGHEMSKWARDTARCLKCFKSAHIVMPEFHDDIKKAGLVGGCVTTDCNK